MEHLGEEIPFQFLDFGLLLVFLKGFITLFHGECLLGALLHLSVIKRLISSLVKVLGFHVVKLAVDVLFKVLFLNPLPFITIEFDRF